MRIHLSVAWIAAGSALLLTGCGADQRRASESSIDATAGVTARPVAATGTAGRFEATVSVPVTDPARRTYVARVDRVCGRIDPERNKEREDSNGALNDVARRYAVASVLSGRELREIEAITPPRGDAPALKTNVFDVIVRQLAIRKQIHQALLERDLASVEARQSDLDDLTRLLAGFARGYGFKVCGTD
jgi:hypothetical protein